MTKTSWHASYGDLVGEKGHYYHQTVILPNVLRLLKGATSVLDMGCGNGVLSHHLPKTVFYTGVDASKSLLPKQKNFLLADCTKPLPLEKKDFDAACFILSLQNMEDGKAAVEQASKHLKPGGKLLLVLNHPCFRIPRQSDWGYDEQTKRVYRRVHHYMSPLKIPIAMQPSKKEKSEMTYSFHHPLCVYASWLKSIIAIEEWCSDKKSEGGRAKAEDRARKEIPLFLAILGQI